MKTIILAAGMARRMFPLTLNTPKSLLQIGNGVTVLESQLNNFEKTGIREIVLVCGYKVEQIEAKILPYSGLDIRIVYNPFYKIADNLVSTWMARHEMNGDFILLNGDNVFNRRVLEGLLRCSHEITMVIEKKDTYDDDDMKVVLKDDRVTRVSKAIPSEQADGGSIGMIQFRGKGIQKFVSTLDRMVRQESSKKVFYLEALQQIMDDSFSVNCFECATDDWAEIDFHPDLEVIKNNISKYYDAIKHWEK